MRSNVRPNALVALPLLCALAACGALPARPDDSTLKASNVPAAIAVPSGSKLAFTLHGSGLQNYECRAKPAGAGGYDWVFVSPEAALSDRLGALVGRHYAGPTWEYGDDSKVTGKVLADAAAPKPGDIAWLLLQGTSSARIGVFNGVTYIQRVNTEGGVAPSDACAANLVGTKKAVPYNADYLFYKS